MLIPRKILRVERNKIIEKTKEDLKGIDIKTLNSYLAIPLSGIFKVSDEVVTIALNDI